jgi:hypothetical protein
LEENIFGLTSARRTSGKPGSDVQEPVSHAKENAGKAVKEKKRERL